MRLQVPELSTVSFLLIALFQLLGHVTTTKETIGLVEGKRYLFQYETWFWGLSINDKEDTWKWAATVSVDVLKISEGSTALVSLNVEPNSIKPGAFACSAAPLLAAVSAVTPQSITIYRKADNAQLPQLSSSCQTVLTAIIRHLADAVWNRNNNGNNLTEREDSMVKGYVYEHLVLEKPEVSANQNGQFRFEALTNRSCRYEYNTEKFPLNIFVEETHKSWPPPFQYLNLSWHTRMKLELQGIKKAGSECVETSLQECLIKMEATETMEILRDQDRSSLSPKPALLDQETHKSITGDAVLRSRLIHYAEQHSAISFLQILSQLRHSSEMEISTVLKTLISAKGERHRRILLAFIEVVGQCGTKHCFEAAASKLRLQSEYADADAELQETFLLSLAYIAPNIWLLESLADLLTKWTANVELRHTLQLVLAHLISKHQGGVDATSDEATNAIVASLFAELRICATSRESDCTMRMLSVMKNLRNAQAVAAATGFVCNSNEALAIAALEVIANTPESCWKSTRAMVFTELEKLVIRQCVGASSATVRLFAASILVSSSAPPARVLLRLFTALAASKSNDREMLAMIMAKAETNPALKPQLDDLKKSASRSLYNYNTLAFGAMSGSHGGQLLQTSNGSSVTYDLESQFSGGVLSRSLTRVSVATPSGNNDLFSFGLFSRGLQSFMITGGADDGQETSGQKEPEAPQEVTAGMTLRLFGFQRKSVVFFSGASELLSAAWSADGHPMNIVQGNYLLNELEETQLLSNGFQLFVSSQTVVSLSGDGSVSISIWYRNAQSRISAKASIRSVASVVLKTMAGETVLMSNLTFTTDGALHFLTDLEFAEMPYKMCLKMMQSTMGLRSTWLTKWLDGNVWKQSQLTKSKNVNGHCFLTHPRISLMCTEMQKNEL